MAGEMRVPRGEKVWGRGKGRMFYSFHHSTWEEKKKEKSELQGPSIRELHKRLVLDAF